MEFGSALLTTDRARLQVGDRPAMWIAGPWSVSRYRSGRTITRLLVLLGEDDLGQRRAHKRRQLVVRVDDGCLAILRIDGHLEQI